VVQGTKAHAQTLRGDVEAALSEVGLSLNEDKTSVCHIDEGFDFLGFRIQRQVKRGSNKAFVYTWPSRKSLSSIMAKVKAKSIQERTTHSPTSCANSMASFEAGRTTSVTACPRTPSPTCTSSPGCG
jgi:RNA-directed DNA polymerase